MGSLGPPLRVDGLEFTVTLLPSPRGDDTTEVTDPRTLLAAASSTSACASSSWALARSNWASATLRFCSASFLLALASLSVDELATEMAFPPPRKGPSDVRSIRSKDPRVPRSDDRAGAATLRTPGETFLDRHDFLGGGCGVSLIDDTCKEEDSRDGPGEKPVFSSAIRLITCLVTFLPLISWNSQN